jgi:hypothetical protein
VGTCRGGKGFSAGEFGRGREADPPGAAGCPSGSADGATGMGPDGRRFPGAVAAAWLLPPSLLTLLPFGRVFRAFPRRTILCAPPWSFVHSRRATALLSFSACSGPVRPGSVTRCAGTSRSPAGAHTPVVPGGHPATFTPSATGRALARPPADGISPIQEAKLDLRAFSRALTTAQPKLCRRWAGRRSLRRVAG